MQTFMPYPSFRESADCLDLKRLNKQRIEAFQILQILKGLAPKKDGKVSWAKHPAVKMWAGYENALALYGIAICNRWREIGYKDSLLEKFESLIGLPIVFPKWFGDDRLHMSHRSNLLRKNKEFYGKFNWSEKNDIPYFWPTKE